MTKRTKATGKASMRNLHFSDMRLEGVQSTAGENYLLFQSLLRLSEDGDARLSAISKEISDLLDLADQANKISDQTNRHLVKLLNRITGRKQ